MRLIEKDWPNGQNETSIYSSDDREQTEKKNPLEKSGMQRCKSVADDRFKFDFTLDLDNLKRFGDDAFEVGSD